MNNKIEILAPAGSLDGMRAAMNAGCDAVYIGGMNFGARAYANNLDEESLLRAIDEAHVRDKKLYLTVNTLIKEQELTELLYPFLEKFYLQGLDAVIVQDVGVLHFIHEKFPELPIHASTQTTLTMAEGANLLKPYGVTRLVTARELNINEIKTIRDHTDLEIETFVHGALCYCYSGQCLMSSIIGGRSGNRGRCAQPCRMPYQFYSDGRKLSNAQEKYLLSPKDMNTLAILPELAQAGINSFKIEGRMKRPEYAAAVSSLYRKYLSRYYESGKEAYHRLLGSREFEQDMLKLQDVYNRGGFSEGYLNNSHGKQMMSLYRPNHSGVFVGKVCTVNGNKVTIELSEEVNAQDVLEIRHSVHGEKGYEFTVKDAHGTGTFLETVTGKRRDILKSNIKQEHHKDNNAVMVIQKGDQVYRIRNNELMDRLAEEYLSKDRKLGILGFLRARIGEPLKLTAVSGKYSATAYGETVQEAVKQPITKEKLSVQLKKTGDTLFYFAELNIDCSDNVFIPVAWLNELRREAIARLQDAITESCRRTKAVCSFSCTSSCFPEPAKDYLPEIVIAIQTREQLEQALTYPEVAAIYADYRMLEPKSILRMAEAAEKVNKEFYAVLPPICRLAEYNRLKRELIDIARNKKLHGFVIKNFEEVALLQSLLKEEWQEKRIILNYNMYTSNREAKAFWKNLNITHYTAPVELNYRELKQLGITDSDLVVYGYQQVMVSAQCLFESTQSCKKSLKSNQGYLIDRRGKKFFVLTDCISCSNTIYNGQALSLLKQEKEIKALAPRRIRLDFTIETKDEMKRIIESFINVYCYGIRDIKEPADYTTGHFRRGVE